MTSVPRNLYPGINAHLHSHFQAAGGWNGFHASHIVHLTAALKAGLLPLGYTADLEASLQIRRFDGHTARTEKPHRAIAIRHQPWVSGSDTAGRVVAWVELLSPSNKPGGQDAGRFREKRLQVLDAGIVFVEIDYLHESPPTFVDDNPQTHRIGEPAHGKPWVYDFRVCSDTACRVVDDNPTTYRIVVLDPRPDLWSAQGRVIGFGVGSPIPTVTIPLNGTDTLHFDFDAPYQTTFEAMLYGLERVDYADFPAHFDRYHEADQARILALMIAIRQSNGGELDVQDLSLQDALKQWEAIR